MFLGAGGAGVFGILSGVAAQVVANAEAVLIAQVEITLRQSDPVLRAQTVSGEVLLELRCDGRRRGAVGGNDLRDIVLLLVVIDEEEDLVLFHRTAQRTAELVEVVRVLLHSRTVVHEGIGVHALIAIKLEYGAVQLVVAALGDHVDDAAGRAANLSREGIGVHLEFLNRVLAESIRTKAGTAGGLGEEQVIGICAVDEQRIGRPPLTAERKVSAAAGILHHAGRENSEVDEIAAIDRKIGYGAGVDTGGGGGAGGFDDRSFGGNVNRLRRGANLKNDIQGDHRSHSQLNAFVFGFLKTRGFHRDVIGANRQAERIETGIAGGGGAGQAVVRIAHTYFGGHNQRARGIGNRSIERGATDFGLGRKRQS